VSPITVCTHQVTDKPAEAIDERRLAPWELTLTLSLTLTPTLTLPLTLTPTLTLTLTRLAPWERGASLAEGGLHDGLRLPASMLIDQTRRPGAWGYGRPGATMARAALPLACVHGGPAWATEGAGTGRGKAWAEARLGQRQGLGRGTAWAEARLGLRQGLG